MNRISRMQLLKLAGKQTRKPKGYSLAGAKNPKGLQKFLDNAKESYLGDSKELKRTIDEIARLEARRDELAASTKQTRQDIGKVYEMIQVMGLHGAKEVRISDDNEVAYVRDGKLFHYDKKTDEMIPRNKYRKDQLSAEDGQDCGDSMFDDDGSGFDSDTTDIDSLGSDDVSESDDLPLDAKMMANELDWANEGAEFKRAKEEQEDQENLGW